jgi:hypothetical protein
MQTSKAQHRKTTGTEGEGCSCDGNTPDQTKEKHPMEAQACAEHPLQMISSDSEPWYVPLAPHTHKQVSLHYTPNKQNGCITAQASSSVAVKPTGSQLQSSKLAAKVSPYQWHWKLPCAFDGGLFCYEGGNRLGEGGEGRQAWPKLAAQSMLDNMHACGFQTHM